MIEVEGRRIEFQETGTGSPLLFVPGSYSTAASWRPMQSHLPSDYRFVSTSLCGYGVTEDTRTMSDTGIKHEIAVIDAVAGEIGEPVHLVGHSFGATVAIATALSGRVDMHSLAVFEANPLTLIRNCGHHGLFAAVKRMSQDFELAQRAGDPNAPGRIIDFWDGAGSFDALPEAVQDYCRSNAHTNVLDWHSDFGFEAAVADYEMLNIPVLLVRGALANEAMSVMTEALEGSLPNSRLAIVKDASHSLVHTHARECARLLTKFLTQQFG